MNKITSVFFLKGIILIIFTGFVLSVYGQENLELQDYNKKNLIKLNSFALAFKNVSLFYEKAIIPRATGSLGVSYKFKSKPPLFYFENDYASIHLKMEKIRGYSISPELRYYLKSCETLYPSGLYSGIYFRYTRYKSDLDIRYIDDSKLEYFYTSFSKMDEYGLGIQIGYQLHINDWLMMDFLIIGPRFSLCNVKMTFDENINDEFITDVEKYIQHFVDKFELSYKVELNEVDFKNIRSKFDLLNWRYGLAIGIAF